MLDKNNIPQHIAVIMDGNGRWAREKGLPRTSGHREGVERVREIVNAAGEFGVKVITFFAFSTENWNRPKIEVDMLMRYMDNFLEKETSKMHKNNIRLIVIGRDEPLPKSLQKKIKACEAKTRDNTGLTVVLCLNYGSRQEIVDAVKKVAASAMRGEINLENLSADAFAEYLYTAGIPDPDILIRTSGEMRLSNFLLWQLSYAELVFSKKYWPDFRREDLRETIEEYQNRERRFGRADAYKKNN